MGNFARDPGERDMHYNLACETNEGAAPHPQAMTPYQCKVNLAACVY